MMQELVTVRLHGVLADKYGAEHAFAISSPREAIQALDANYPGFRRDFLAHPSYALLADGDWRDEANCPDVANAPVSKELDIVPFVEGRNFVPLIAAGITAISGGAISGIAATLLAGAITLGLSIGVSLLLAPKAKKTQRDSSKDESYMFSGPENVTEQGVPVPLVYGRLIVGSVVVSAGLEVADNLGTASGNNWVWNQMVAAMGLRTMAFNEPAEAIAALVQEPPEAEPERIETGRTWPRWIPENA